MPQRIADPVKSAFLFLALVFLASCSSSEPDLGLGLDFTREAGYPVAHLKYRDRDPQDFGSRPPGRYPVHGIDVSKWQGHIDWQAVKASGVEFAFIKATEGGDLLDSRFKRYTSDARAAGIPTGRLSFLLFLPFGRRTGALVHSQCAEKCRRPAAGARHGVEPYLAKLQAAAFDKETVRKEMRNLVDDGRTPLRPQADHLYDHRLLRENNELDISTITRSGCVRWRRIPMIFMVTIPGISGNILAPVSFPELRAIPISMSLPVTAQTG